MKKVAFVTLGCKVNQYETNELSALLAEYGYGTVGVNEDADVYVVNSCCVTGESGRKSRQAVRRLRAAHPGAVIVLTGCFPQAFPEEAALNEADIIIGNRTNRKLPALLDCFFSKQEQRTLILPHRREDPYDGVPIRDMRAHTRAFVKIQDGCNRYCTYCIIPKSRGFSRSRSPEDIRLELSSLSKNGYREIVFVGINLSAYGRDIGLTLADAVRIAQETPGIERVRLGSLEPDHITDDLIETLAGMDKFCPQFHLSLQSGCDKTLKRMNRHYTAQEFAALTAKLRDVFEDVSLTTDVIVGFPGETEEDFAKSCDFVKEQRFMKVHIFPYSAREGTPAAGYPDQIPQEIKAARASHLQAICEPIRMECLRALTGNVREVLFETPKGGRQRGYTKNYTPVSVKSDEALCGRILPVLITGTDGKQCTGELTADTI